MKYLKIKDIKPNPNNPRIIKDDKFKKLVQSIKDFPEMLELRPIVVDSDMVVLGGNMRLKALNEIGVEEIPVLMAEDLTEEQKRQFIIKDNVGFGEWDWDLLGNEWDENELVEWGLDVWQPDEDLEKEEHDLSGEISQTFEVIVECADELEQEKIYLELTKQGKQCRVLTL